MLCRKLYSESWLGRCYFGSQHSHLVRNHLWAAINIQQIKMTILSLSDFLKGVAMTRPSKWKFGDYGLLLVWHIRGKPSEENEILLPSSVFFLNIFAQIGVILRDSHGVAQVRYITGNKILRILKAKGNFYRVSWILFFFLLVLVMKLWKLIVQHFIFLSGLAGSLPEDLYFLIKKAVAVRKHLETHRKVCVIINFDINPFAPKLPVQIHCHTNKSLFH